MEQPDWPGVIAHVQYPQVTSSCWIPGLAGLPSRIYGRF